MKKEDGLDFSRRRTRVILGRENVLRKGMEEKNVIMLIE